MLIIYATMLADEKMKINNKRLNIELDNDYLANKIVVMDEDYYLNHAHEFNDIRIIVVGKNNASKELDIEYHQNIYKLANSKYFMDKELYIVGSNKLIKEAIPLCDKMIFNIINTNIEETDKTTISFPKYDFNNWRLFKGEQVTPTATRITLNRINSYDYKQNKVKKRLKK